MDTISETVRNESYRSAYLLGFGVWVLTNLLRFDLSFT